MNLPPFLHWAIVLSEERPELADGELPRGGTKVRRPDTGLVVELRNSVKTHLIYLDVKNWTNYVYLERDISGHSQSH